MKRQLFCTAALCMLLSACFQTQLGGPTGDTDLTIAALREPGNILASGRTRSEQFWVNLKGQADWDAKKPNGKLLLLGILTKQDMPLEGLGLDPAGLYLVTATGGVDMDPSTSGTVSDAPEDVQGSWHAIATGQRILDGNLRVSALTEAVYQQVRTRLDRLSDQDIIEQLDAAARLLVTDTDNSGTVDYNDVLRFSRDSDASRFRGDIAQLDGLAEALRAGQPVDALANQAAEVFGSHRVVMTTNYGNLVMDTLNWEAPVSVDNFLRYVEDGFYERIVFHRILEGFVIQAGLWELNNAGTQIAAKETRGAIRNEARYSASNTRGTVAYARTSDPDSATSQFFVNQFDNSADLDFGSSLSPDGYAVFARLVSGLDVLDTIAALPVVPFSGVSEAFPNPEVALIESVTVSD